MIRPAVAITGFGAMSCFGPGVARLEQGLEAPPRAESLAGRFVNAEGGAAGASGARPHSRHFKRLPRSYQFALLAVEEALAMSGINLSEEGERTGIFLGTDHGAAEQTYDFVEQIYAVSPRLARPLLFQNTTFSSGAGEISLRHGIKGPSFTVANGFTSMLTAISTALVALWCDRIQHAIVLGTDELTALQQEVLAALGKSSATGRAQPFDLARDGFVPGEGAAALVLESSEAAAARGGTVLGHIAGVGLAHDGAATPLGHGLRRAMEAALDPAGLAPDAVGCIFAAASGARREDRLEGEAIAAFAGDNVPVAALKARFGEAHAASAGLQIGAALWSMRSGIIPATIAGATPDPACRVKPTTCEAIEQVCESILVNGYSYGGNAASLLITR